MVKLPSSINDPNLDTYFSSEVENYVLQHEHQMCYYKD